jgi:hypothetical protein
MGLFSNQMSSSKMNPFDILAFFNVLQITQRDFYYLWKKHIGEGEGLINNERYI